MREDRRHGGCDEDNLSFLETADVLRRSFSSGILTESRERRRRSGNKGRRVCLGCCILGLGAACTLLQMFLGVVVCGVCECVWMHLCACLCICLSVCLFVCLWVGVSVSMCVCCCCWHLTHIPDSKTIYPIFLSL